MWGQDTCACYCGFFTGIIPTRVGTSRIYGTALVILWDHPHACGDKLASAFNMDKVEGSSPRVWGQASWDKIFEEFPRIIPTRVGTSYCARCDKCNGKDHPHACGDKGAVATVPVTSLGSSPRVWGQDDDLRKDEFHLRIIPTRVGTSKKNLKNFYKPRIIPTRVGTSRLIDLEKIADEDHPHACGDKKVQTLKKTY